MRLAEVAGASTTEFQRWAAASVAFGIEQDKLSDILKDVNDRVGDFMSTGGGPMKDFFEQIAPLVGVTAKQFEGLSGPQALQLYVDTIERAGANQQQMTFYLEAMASDVTALLPLLRNGGAEMRRLGDAAEESGRVMSRTTLDAAVRLDRRFRDISSTIRTSLNRSLLENSESFEKAAEVIAEVFVPAIGKALGKISDLIVKLGEAKELVDFMRDPTSGVNPDAFAPSGFGEEGGSGDPVADSMNRSAADPGLNDLYGIPLDPIKVSPDDNDPPGVPSRPAGVDPYGGAGSGAGAGGGGGVSREQFEALRRALATEREIVEEDRLRRLEELAAYREKEVATEQEYADTKRRIQEDYAEAMRELDERERAAKLSAMQGVFGDLASMMSSENKKLFKLGKMAAIAEASVDGYRAAVSAWKHGMKIGGPPMAATFAAASAVKTGGLIASIASQQIGGSGGSASAGGGSPAGGGAGAVAETPSPNMNVYLSGGSGGGFGEDQLMGLLEMIRDKGVKGANLNVYRV
ncbi:hypothetical protein CVM50_17220 [Pseudooceanicola marinus]|nr:hypothetical protein CVM50_17220 [Pseudooceanicola marinus]